MRTLQCSPGGMDGRRVAGKRVRRRRVAPALALAAVVAVVALTGGAVFGGGFTIDTPFGRVAVDVGHLGAGGVLVAPETPEPQPFRPPSIFSAPLPSGSGARALGLGGAFTAVADDATAASWNPAGLIQLERPEASAVLRVSHNINLNHSDDSDYLVGRDTASSLGVNYLSAVYPFRWAGRNWVFSMNYQEAYDFTQAFGADISSTSVSSSSRTTSRQYEETVSQRYVQGSAVNDDWQIDIVVNSHLKTLARGSLRELLTKDLVSRIDFEQEGGIDAATPALAVELTPSLYIGAAVNVYQDSPQAGGSVQSRTRAAYSGRSTSRYGITEERTTSGTYDYAGTVDIPPGGIFPNWQHIPISGSGAIPAYSDTSSRSETGSLDFDGVYDERNEYDGFYGANATLGALWTVNRRLGLGLCVDLPWTARADQTRQVRNTITTYDRSRSRVLDVSEELATLTKDVEFEFPLYWALGAVWRWSTRLYTTLDISETLWSDFAFRAAGEGKLNPFDGTPYGQNRIDDCWSARCGIEYLWVLTRTDVPFRAGVTCEQRPAIGSPDLYWGGSVGSGIALGRGDNRFIVDVAYTYMRGNDVLESLVPDQPGLSTDAVEHECYVSCIKHF